ncbi:FadR/GntR family transcriptional regulator [Rhizobium paknamense]|uniref:DNA-binding FadR family transcriptional regulator n=1 Tax=Rhizobium paknamense TaxID=1206817 RepID=A0ABU0IDE1_9HYPH|nr:FadR/GntR family transcriptional regulator [Rhizobium paknamense]MDQ0455707.1 DNA-binding FadR family transcriptional regulator [Rhizobium paknamense]
MASEKQQISQPSKGKATLVTQLVEKLRAAILSGEFRPGDRLPSEAQMTQDYEVSRTVIREAVAALKSDGLVEPRQGAGVFVLALPTPVSLPFQNVDSARVSSVIELLELRIAVEIEAAALAAQRRSPQQEETILSRHRDLFMLIEAGQPTVEADFALHLAIAEATNNPRFPEFLSMIGRSVIPRAVLNDSSDPALQHSYLSQIHQEHAAIVEAISNGDDVAARAAMKLHLRGSLSRYRSAHQRSLMKI